MSVRLTYSVASLVMIRDLKEQNPRLPTNKISDYAFINNEGSNKKQV